MNRSNRFPIPLLTLLVFAGLLFLIIFPPFLSPIAELQKAWQHANAVGVYTYQTEIQQTAHPLPLLANVGLSSTEKQIYIQGKVNRPAKQLQLSLWDGGQVAVAAASAKSQPVQDDLANFVAPANSVQIRVDNDKSYGRTGLGIWQELKEQDVTGVFAPGRDVLAYLAAAKNVQPGIPASQAEGKFTRYTFDLDGPTLAQYMSKQLQAELQRKGKLPPGLSVDLTKQYA